MAFSAEPFWGMGPTSSRSLEPSLNSSLDLVQTQLTAHTKSNWSRCCVDEWLSADRSAWHHALEATLGFDLGHPLVEHLVVLANGDLPLRGLRQRENPERGSRRCE